MALKNGKVIAWGYNNQGQTDVPAAALTGVVAIAAGEQHSLALKLDGTVVAWGSNSDGQSSVLTGLTGVVAIAAGDNFSLALKSDGTIVGWGRNDYGQGGGGNTDLKGLTLQEGAFTSVFTPAQTDYTFAYVGASVSNVHVTASLADRNAKLYMNNQQQTNSTTVTVGVSGVSTVIPIRVDHPLLPSKTYKISVLRDSTAPGIVVSKDGNLVGASFIPDRTAATQVTVNDSQSGVNVSSLKYAWTQSATPPIIGWNVFRSGDTLTKAGVDGYWYLHIVARDNVGNEKTMTTKPFLLDNQGPTFNVTMTTADHAVYQDNTWTNQDVIVSAALTGIMQDDLTTAVTSFQYSLNGGTVWQPYTAQMPPIELHGEGTHRIIFKAVDYAGNETVVERRAKIDLTGPAASFSRNGSLNGAVFMPVRVAATQVTVSDALNGVDASSLAYAWTQDATPPAIGWNSLRAATR